ncbi:MAG: hypothetical protein LIP09_09500 [Bacteroidales bacterium]|nr:hypothetical protein [Bacteroidales bacterium]
MKRLTLSDFEPIYADWKNSGLSVIDYCASIGIKHKRFYMWKNRYELAHPQGPSEQKAS